MSGAQSLPTGRKRSRPGGGSGSALDKTAKARLSTYDAKHAQKQKHALQSKKVNEYRKLVKRLKASDGAQVAGRQAVSTSKSGPSKSARVAESGHLEAQTQPPAEEKAQQPQPPAITEPDKPENSQSAPDPAEPRRKRRNKRASRLERMAAEVQQQKAAAEEARAEAEKAAAQHRQQMAQRQQERKKQTQLMRKVTKSGQPVMKYRIDMLLDKIAAG